MSPINLILFVAICVTQIACGGVTRMFDVSMDPRRPYETPVDFTAPRNIAIFFDGTGNDLNSITNLGKLYQFVVNQDRRDIAAFYTSGVGADSTGPLGLATGLGFRKDVQAAYGFLSEAYRDNNDVLHLYGYSRGAFSARALAGLVHTVGLVNLPAQQQEKEQFLHELFSAYKFPYRFRVDASCLIRKGTRHASIDRRRCATQTVLKKYKIVPKETHDQVRFAIVGLWDTVETLGGPNYRDDPDRYNPRYADQICNMDKVFHAISLDDNRAGSYSPVLMTRKRLVSDCEPSDTSHFERVKEVWFAGDHAQVGGTEPLGHLSGVSMNWMLESIKREQTGSQTIVPKGARVFEQPLEYIKDAQGQNLLFRLIRRLPRNVLCYAEPKELDDWSIGSAQGFILIHRSVIDRKTRQPIQAIDRRSPTGKPPSILPETEVLLNRDRLLNPQNESRTCATVPIFTIDNANRTQRYIP